MDNIMGIDYAFYIVYGNLALYIKIIRRLGLG